MNNDLQVRQGIFLAIAAYTMWGIAPIYFKSLQDVPPFEVLTHRILWSFVFLSFILFFTKGFKQLLALKKEPKRLAMLCVSAVVIAGNWLLFIWAVNTGHMLDASLGYFINPLFNVFLGMVFLNERFRKLQWFAVSLAFMGVGIQLITFGSIPWIALLLASSFGTYGLLRKKVQVGAALGLFVETAILFPVAAIYLLMIADTSSSDLFSNTWDLNALLFAAGIITTVPLLCFNGAATRLKLSTLGFFQYLGPTLMFILAVTLYKEPLTADKATTFAFIWAALMVFIFDAIKKSRHPAQAKMTE